MAYELEAQLQKTSILPASESIGVVLGQVRERLADIENRLLQLRQRVSPINQDAPNMKNPPSPTLHGDALELRKHAVRIVELVVQLEQAL